MNLDLKSIFVISTLKFEFVNKYMRFIRLYGYHLKGPHGRVLLFSVTFDANCKVFAIVVYICEGENIKP